MSVSFSGSGQVISQVISTTKTDTFTTSSTISASGGALVNTGAAVTGLTATITPRSSSNKVLVRVSMYGIGTASVGQMMALLYRGSTVIGNGTTTSARPGIIGRATYVAVNEIDSSVSFEYLDSPATTSATIYSVNVGSDTGAVYVNRTATDGDNALGARLSSTITVMEIAYA
jgi:hypothetical protein